jgi:hypothetical protein
MWSPVSLLNMLSVSGTAKQEYTALCLRVWQKSGFIQAGITQRQKIFFTG